MAPAGANQTTLNIRGIDAEAVQRAKLAAAARGMTIGQYVAALVALHEASRSLADNGDRKLARALALVGLATVSA